MDSADFPRLLRALRRCETAHFYLFFVRCNSPQYRQQLVAAIKAQSQIPIIEISIQTLMQKYDFDNFSIAAALTIELDTLPPDQAVFIYDLEAYLPNPREQVFETIPAFQTLQQINWQRSVYQRLNRALFFWLPEYALQLLATHALDFFDWRSAIYEFDIPKSQQNDIMQAELQGFRSGELHAADYLNKAEKQRWIKMLHSLLDEATTTEAQADLQNDLGRIYYSIGKYDISLDAYQKALDLSRQTHQQQLEGTTLNNISQIFKARGDYETALGYLKQSLEIAQEIRDRKNEGGLLNNMSTIAYAKGDYETALGYLKQSLLIRQEISDRSGEGTTLNNISQIYSARGDYETALGYLKQSLLIRQEIGDMSGMCATLFNIGHIHLENKEQQEALAAWVQSYLIANKIGEAQALQNLDNLAKQLGGTGLEYWEQLAKQLNS
ncbi:tetratricopeptide repeat protein [Candidatus Albibeggiatoa sp. nov. BB20]|uniref:tetratricopeptide repeat protein n=1 Tax=Candidatus Albibeggiatoa sp. nov. BB20 TaxID=3162723 RepID=UPI003365581F